MEVLNNVRQNLRDAIVARKSSAIALSRTIGRNDSFVAQYLAGRMKKLGDLDRLHLAMALEIDERLLGAREPWVPPGATPRPHRPRAGRTTSTPPSQSTSGRDRASP